MLRQCSPRIMAILSAAMGGFGVFSAIGSFTSPAVAARAIILLIGALALSLWSSSGGRSA
jgi:hypothetical protein